MGLREWRAASVKLLELATSSVNGSITWQPPQNSRDMVCWKPTTLPVAAVPSGNSPRPSRSMTLVLHCSGGRLIRNQSRITADTAADPSASITRTLEIDISIHVLAGLGAGRSRAHDDARRVHGGRMAVDTIGQLHVGLVGSAGGGDTVARAAIDLALADPRPDREARAVTPGAAGGVGAVPVAAAGQHHLGR